MSNYIKVFSGNFIEVQRIFQALEAKNICAIIKDEAETGVTGYGTSVQGVQEIHVHKDELERAASLVENLTSELEA